MRGLHAADSLPTFVDVTSPLNRLAPRATFSPEGRRKVFA